MHKSNKMSAQVFLDAATEIVTNFAQGQEENIDKAATICANAIEKGGVIHVFGSGHSLGVGLELIGRPGNLVPIHQIFTTDFVTKGNVPLDEFRDPVDRFERRPYLADKLYDMYDVHKEDVFLIISNSGINGLVIDLAIKAKQEGHPVIVITSLQHTTVEDSRHPSGHKLMDLGDVVIDNAGPHGDALLTLEDGSKIASISSIVGVIVSHDLTEGIVRKLQEKNVEVPVLKPNTSDENIKYNEELLERYQGRI